MSGYLEERNPVCVLNVSRYVGMTRVCTLCGEEKEASAANFAVSSVTKYADGSAYMNPRCRRCVNKVNKGRHHSLSKEELATLNAKKREYRNKNLAKARRDSKEYHKQEIIKYRTYIRVIHKTYGLSEQSLRNMMDSQRGCCAVCECSLISPGGWRVDMCIDHCHSTKEVRGLLCSKCNKALGLFGDNTDTLQSAIDYLKKHKEN
ncbi:MAG: endonuclease VII domain-containing protein [Candidatus Peribacteraceae bacterium]|nr:endonuclease VII domain-containing protein [Candidatus Peribacteraceae bacterium]